MAGQFATLATGLVMLLASRGCLLLDVDGIAQALRLVQCPFQITLGTKACISKNLEGAAGALINIQASYFNAVYSIKLS